MKIKLWQWQSGFHKEDARVVVPLILLLLGLVFTRLSKKALWGGAVACYLLYFFLGDLVARVRLWLFFRYPYCKSREIVMQGHQGHNSDPAFRTAGGN
jgi:hypothetical protein